MATPGDDNTARGMTPPPKKLSNTPPPKAPQPEPDSAEDEVTIRRASPVRPAPKPASKPVPQPEPDVESENEATMASGSPVFIRSVSPPTPEPDAGEDATIPKLARAAVQGPPPPADVADVSDDESKYEEESTRRSSAAPIPLPEDAPVDESPQAAEAPDASEPEAKASARAPEGGNTMGYQRQDAPPPSEVINALGRLRAKLLVVLGGTKQIHEVTQVPFIVGRDPQVNCRIQHDTVSGSHAIIDFDGKSFTIEDLGSKNATKLGNAQLRKGQKFELPPESALRFAAAEALFFLENPEEPRAARALQERAGDILARDGKVTREQRRDAARGSRPETAHLGARLVLEADVRPADWNDAARRGREGVGKGFPLWLLLLWLVLALAVGTLVGWFLYMKG